MKIIGWYRKGNVVRLALGNDSLVYWSGDDWNDKPYEHNADTMPLNGIQDYIDVAFDLDVSVMEPKDDYHYKGNSPFSMDDFQERKAPFLAIDVTGKETCYSQCVNKEEIFAIYMGDRIEDIDWSSLGATII